MLSEQDFPLFNTILWQDPVNVGTIFKFSTTDITDTYQKYEKRQWLDQKYFIDNFNNVRTAVLTLLERVIELAYHSAQMRRHVFGNDELPDIITRLQCLYGQQILGELYMALLHLNNPMDQNQLVEVMLRAIKEVQMFLLAHPKACQELANKNLISYSLINLKKTGGMYTKVLEHWKAKELTYHTTWPTFCQHMIGKFEKLITSGARPTIGQEGYGGVYNMTETANDGDSLANSTVRYSERATATKSKVSNLVIHLSQLKMGGPPILAP